LHSTVGYYPRKQRWINPAIRDADAIPTGIEHAGGANACASVTIVRVYWLEMLNWLRRHAMRGLRTLALAGLATGLLTSPAYTQTVKVGIILTYSGADLNNGLQIDRAMRLYIKEHEKDLPPGVKVELVVKDDGGPNPDAAKRLAQELIVRDKVNLIAGLVWTPNAAAIAPVVTEARVPLVLMNAASSGLPNLSPYIVRVSYTLWQFAYPMGEWAAKQGAKTAYSAVPDFVPGHEIEAAFAKGFTGSGGRMVGSVRVPLNTIEYLPYLHRVKDAKPDVFYLMTIGGARATSMLKLTKELDFEGAGIKVMGSCELVADDDLPRTGNTAHGHRATTTNTGFCIGVEARLWGQ
jgi:branched-chain amino acid transport system substrate-binding protein